MKCKICECVIECPEVQICILCQERFKDAFASTISKLNTFAELVTDAAKGLAGFGVAWECVTKSYYATPEDREWQSGYERKQADLIKSKWGCEFKCKS